MSCTRLQYIARMLFAKLYNDDRLTYRRIKITFYDDEIRNFGYLANKMWLGGTANSLRLMVENDCEDTLRRLIFGHMHHIDFRDIPGLERIFANLTELAFFRCTSLSHMPLEHCQNLIKLDFYGKFFDEEIAHVYPKLKFFRCEYDTTDPNVIKQFLLRHPNLTDVILYAVNSDIVPLPSVEKLVIRNFQCSYYSSYPRMPKLKTLEVGMHSDDAQNASKLARFLTSLSNPENIIEFRLPRFRTTDVTDRTERRNRWVVMIGRDDFVASVSGVVECITRFINLRTLKIDMHEFGLTSLREFHVLSELRHLKLKDTRHIDTNALVELIHHLPHLESLSIYNTQETQLLLNDEDGLDSRVLRLYRIRTQQFTVSYFKRPLNAGTQTEDFIDDVYELCQQQMPYHKYKTFELNAKVSQ